MVIAVDFDGTIVEHAFPGIGKEKPFAFDSLKRLISEGHQIILWTSRKGESLKAAVEFCRQNGVEFYAVNKNFPEEEWTEDISRKIVADIYIDDRNLGGFPGWGEAYQMISSNNNTSAEATVYKKLKKKSPLGSFFKKLLSNLTE
jgi:hydroxymethylpyrimidine pyrophosphatase-like HAD family hydrolase